MNNISLDVLKITDVRVSVNKKYTDIYKSLSQSSNIRKSIFERHAKIFTFCAALGFNKNKRNKFNSGDLENLFWSKTFGKHDLTVIYSLAVNDYSENITEIINDKEKMISIAEEYADGGMEILIDNVLSEFIKEKEDGILYLNHIETSYLEKEVLSFINSIVSRDPF